jgi:hypothetical protein
MQGLGKEVAGKKDAHCAQENPERLFCFFYPKKLFFLRV